LAWLLRWARYADDEVVPLFVALSVLVAFAPVVFAVGADAVENIPVAFRSVVQVRSKEDIFGNLGDVLGHEIA